MEASEVREHLQRRAVLQAAIGVGTGVTLLSTLYVGAGLIPKKEITPETEPIAVGDFLVFGQGDKKGQAITSSDIQEDTLQIIAYPMNPQTKVVKSAEAANTVLLLKLDPASLTPQTAKYAVQGIVAYSGVCKHLGCIVSNWDRAKQILVCPCHQGRYDPKQSAKVVGGPPPKPLPQLPLGIEANHLVARGRFLGPVGPGR